MYGFSLCYGFGYDSSTDDYKVFVGAEKGENRTCVRVLRLKSNVWRVIPEVEYTFITKVGILCNGALHWLIRDDENKKRFIIISFERLFVHICIFLCWLRMVDEKVQCKRVIGNVVT
ncbi:putative F-box associated interaction domain-containing protein [Helianthus annuus]|nr:putative F-box associated interaction domain-containing protein [Helianthus annuus]